MARKQGAPEARFAREESLGYLVNRLARLFARGLERRLARHGVPHGQFKLLLVLWEDERLTQTELARRLDIEQPTVASTLSRMVRDGLVETAPDPLDGRRTLVRVTKKGHALREPLTAEAQALNELATEGWSEGDVKRMRKGLVALAKGLEKAGEEA
jgi:DNA-binding MarR family transcriptional regulator